MGDEASPWAPPPESPSAEEVRPGRFVRWFGWPHRAIPPAQQAAAARDRRPRGVEIWIVLAIFPGTSVISAIAALVSNARADRGVGLYLSSLDPDHPVINALMNLAAELVRLVPAVLVAYLLANSGGGLRAIGLDRDQVREDLSYSGKFLTLAHVLPQFLAVVFLAGVGYDASLTVAPPGAVALIALLPSGIVAGIVEEVVVLGYLVHRLEQRGWTSTQVLVAAVAVRVSYHLYYGWSVLGIVGWAIVSVILYRRTRRLLTFIVVHALWDISAFAAVYLHHGATAIPFLLMAASVTALFFWGRGSRTSDPVPG